MHFSKLDNANGIHCTSHIDRLTLSCGCSIRQCDLYQTFYYLAISHYCVDYIYIVEWDKLLSSHWFFIMNDCDIQVVFRYT